MKKAYLAPETYVVDVKVEKGFAVSPAADSFGIEDFNYIDGTGKDENTAW